MGNLTNVTGKALSVLRFLRQTGPESAIPKHWLLKTQGRLNRQFARENKIEVTPYGEYNRVIIQGQTFLYPGSADLRELFQVSAELFLPDHPHQYLFGATKVTADDVVLDIGACEGTFSAMMTSRVRRVISVEPSREMCELMRDLFALREESCPVIVNCLLGSEPSVAHFEFDIANVGASRMCARATPTSYPVQVRTLDDLVEELDAKPTFIKCDAEGAEHAIFTGGQNFLRSHRPKLAIATYHNDGDYAEVYHLLKSFGYQIEGKGLFFSPGDDGSIRAMMIHAW